MTSNLFIRKLPYLGKNLGKIMRYLIYLTIIVSTSLQAGAILKWVDEDGNTHYGDAPPTKTKSEKINVQSAPTNLGKALPRLSTEASGEEEPASTDDSKTDDENNAEVPEDQAILACDKAREDLSVIKKSSRIKLRLADGTSRYLSSEEITQRKEKANADISRFCN
ncbi:MAG: hypothetical protein ACI9LO_001056 [Planctomycetota bacterium]|jgi:hypothetical protein